MKGKFEKITCGVMTTENGQSIHAFLVYLSETY